MSLTNRKIRWGIIGLGHIAHSFTKDLLTVGDAELYAVASRNLSKAEDFKTTYHAQKAYGSYHDMLKDTAVDAVYIATPHVFHKENTLLSLAHGKAVLCEKPLAMNSDEVEEMIAASKAKKLAFMEAIWTCFLPHYIYVMEVLQQNTMGKLLRVEADFGRAPQFDPESRLFNKELGGGSLLDIGIYPIITALTTLGVPDVIKADARFFNTGVDASCTMTFNYKSGATALLKSTMTEKTPTTATFFCEKGHIKINTDFFKPTTVSLFIDGNESTKDFNYTTIGYSYEILHFNALLRQGKTESPVMSFDFSKKVMKTLDRVRAEIGLQYK